jgi:hypothetical protein
LRRRIFFFFHPVHRKACNCQEFLAGANLI